jgi:diaminopimelate epimerase
VGADGLVQLERPGPDDPLNTSVRVRLWNADGSLAEISGNGARCVARYLVDEGAPGDDLLLATDVGPVQAWVEGNVSRVRLPMTARVYPNRRLRVEGRSVTGTYVEVGVPFFVCFHDDPNDLPVRFLGRAIRRHEDLAPRGANVDFVSVVDEQHLYFRVYERGVEDETLSSGTGSLSAALAAAAAGNVESPVACEARGATLTVRFRSRAAEEAAPALPDEPSRPQADPPAAPNVSDTADSAPTEPESGDTAAAASEIPESTDPPIIGDEEPVEYVDLEIEGEVHRVCKGEAFLEACT